MEKVKPFTQYPSREELACHCGKGIFPDKKKTVCG